MNLKRNKKAQSFISDKTIEWIMYIILIAVAGFAIKQILSKAIG